MGAFEARPSALTLPQTPDSDGEIKRPYPNTSKAPDQEDIHGGAADGNKI